MRNTLNKGAIVSIILAALVVALVVTILAATTTYAGIATTKKDLFGDFRDLVVEYDATVETLEFDMDADFTIDNTYLNDSVSDIFNQMANLKNSALDIEPHACFEPAYWSFLWLLDREMIRLGWYLTLINQTAGVTAEDDALWQFDMSYPTDEMTKDFNKAIKKCNKK